MKSMKKTVASVLVVACMLVCLTACGGSKKFDGTYILKSMNGQTVEDLLAIAEQNGIQTSAEELGKLVIDGDSFTMTNNGQTQTGECEVDGDNLLMTVEGDTVTATLSGNDLTLSGSGITMVFTK